MASHVMTQGERMSLHNAAVDLHTEFRGIFGGETIESLLLDSYAELASRATVTPFLAIGAERFARQRLQALAHADNAAKGKLPPSCSSACTMPGGRRWRSAGSDTSRGTGQSPGPAARSQFLQSILARSPRWPR